MSKIQVKPEELKKMTREQVAKHVQKLREYDEEKVTGIFQNLENRGGGVSFSYKFWPGQENEFYEFRDGERYTIPRGVARWITNSCFFKEYRPLNDREQAMGLRGATHDGRIKAEKWQLSKKVHRFAFHSLEFMDDDLSLRRSDLVEVTVSP